MVIRRTIKRIILSSLALFFVCSTGLAQTLGEQLYHLHPARSFPGNVPTSRQGDTISFAKLPGRISAQGDISFEKGVYAVYGVRKGRASWIAEGRWEADTGHVHLYLYKQKSIYQLRLLSAARDTLTFLVDAIHPADTGKENNGLQR